MYYVSIYCYPVKKYTILGFKLHSKAHRAGKLRKRWTFSGKLEKKL